MQRNEQTQGYQYASYSLTLQGTTEPVEQCRNSQSHPNGISIERTCIGIVTFARLHGCLIKVNDNGNTCHKEQEEHNPELLHTLVHSYCTQGISLRVLIHLPEETQQAEYQRHSIEHVMSLVLTQLRWQLRLVAQAHIVEPLDTCYPVAMLQFTIALNIVLTTGEVPHKVAPVHKVHLIGQEEVEVLTHCGHLYLLTSSSNISLDNTAFHTAHPIFISLLVTVAVHAWEQHILTIFIFEVIAHQFVAVGLIGISFFLTLIYRSALCGNGYPIVALHFHLHLRIVGRTIQ